MGRVWNHLLLATRGATVNQMAGFGDQLAIFVRTLYANRETPRDQDGLKRMDGVRNDWGSWICSCSY